MKSSSLNKACGMKIVVPWYNAAENTQCTAGETDGPIMQKASKIQYALHMHSNG